MKNVIIELDRHNDIEFSYIPGVELFIYIDGEKYTISKHQALEIHDVISEFLDG